MIRQTATIPGQEQLSVANLAASGATSRKRAIRLMWFLVALMLTVSFAFPMYFMVSSSFKSGPEVLANPIHWWPQDYQGLNQYARAFDAVPLLGYFFNSTLMATVDVIVTVIFSALAGYGFAKFNFPGKRWIFLFIL